MGIIEIINYLMGFSNSILYFPSLKVICSHRPPTCVLRSKKVAFFEQDKDKMSAPVSISSFNERTQIIHNYIT